MLQQRKKLCISIIVLSSLKKTLKIGKIIRSKEIFNNINVKKDLSDNRNFWKAIKPCFSNKGLNLNKTLLKEKGNLVSDEKELATIMTTFLLTLQ